MDQADSFQSSLNGIVDTIGAQFAENGGHLTLDNRADLFQDLNHLCRDIYNAAHPKDQE